MSTVMAEKNEIFIPAGEEAKLFIFYNEILLHSARVAAMAGEIAKKLSYGKINVNKLFLAGMWHDIGKLLTMDLVFLNDLSEEQINILNRHPVLSFNLLVQSRDYLAPEVLGLVLFHHIHPDGTGYPRIEGTVSEKIQILSAADVVDAMTHKRHYRNGKTNDKGEALDYLRGCKYKERILSAIGEIELKEKNLPKFFPPSNIKIHYGGARGLSIKIEGTIFNEYLGEGYE
jgi:HD-GYP domain-containing protein (c-di-GMP phosphodiesterase class II)